MEHHEHLEIEITHAFCPTFKGVACSSGTAALHLALEALQLPKGSQVLVPEFTMIASARAVVMAGLKPIFIDCDHRLCMNVDQLEMMMTPQVSAIMPVHVYGRLCNMQAIGEFANKYNLAIIEDCAESIGAVHDHSFSNAVCYSFYKNKVVAGEEGGMACLRYKGSADRARAMRCQGFTPSHDFLHTPGGFNYRMADSQASLVLDSFQKRQANIAARTQVEDYYYQTVPSKWHMPSRSICWVYDIRLPDTDTAKVVKELNDQGIAARHAFKPMSQQPEFRGHYSHLQAYAYSQEVIYLPAGPWWTKKNVEDIVDAVKQAVK